MKKISCDCKRCKDFHQKLLKKRPSEKEYNKLGGILDKLK